MNTEKLAQALGLDPKQLKASIAQLGNANEKSSMQLKKLGVVTSVKLQDKKQQSDE